VRISLEGTVLWARDIAASSVKAAVNQASKVSAKAYMDEGIHRPAVLVHRFQDNVSYIMSGTNHNQDLIAGDVFQVGDPAGSSPWTKVEVLNIDAISYTATVRLSTG